jgi:D-sedoheptulose 7-phosphate isomerase
MKQKMFSVAILAGGLATRLKPLTETIPKSLMDIQGEPFIAYQLRLLSHQRIKQVVLCVGYRGEMIQEVVGNGEQFGIQVHFSFDGPTLLGTAGAIKKALPMLGEDFIVLYGDSYLPCKLRPIQTAFERSARKAMMTVFRNDGRWDRSNVEFSRGQILSYDKKDQTPRMHHIDYGLGVFSKEAFERVPEHQPYDLACLYQELLRHRQLAGYEVESRFYEIGSFAGIEEMRRFAARHLTRRRRKPSMKFAQQYLSETAQILGQLDPEVISRAVELLAETRRRGGRLFILGVGGSSANASHAVNDFRKLVGLEAYAPTDNVSELTARTNDEGWTSVFEKWLETSRLRPDDLLLIFSVGGGNLEKNISPNLVSALKFAKRIGCRVVGVVGRDGGFTAQVADCCIIIPTVNPEHVTAHTEAFQGVVCHLLVSHPLLKASPTKWESVT